MSKVKSFHCWSFDCVNGICTIRAENGEVKISVNDKIVAVLNEDQCPTFEEAFQKAIDILEDERENNSIDQGHS